jgi:formylglycine-generating enzyme required for sulfatase activity
MPQGCVAWCNAIAYCEGVGKRLCGKIGGGPTPYDKAADATQSQWYAACSSGGKHVYPFGDQHVAAACNGYDAPTVGHDAVSVASFTDCQSSEVGYAGVYDLSGNVHELEDSCQVSDITFCHTRGSSTVGPLDCADQGVLSITTAYPETGFRCCKD